VEEGEERGLVAVERVGQQATVLPETLLYQSGVVSL